MKNLSAIFEKNQQKINNFEKMQFERYFSMLVETNENFNLTSIIEEDDVVLKHFLDSILPMGDIPTGSSVVDVGSGAGFPAIPLKIMRPDISICMVDSLNKRVNFLNEVIETLNLNNSTAIHSRAEEFASQNREKFDIAVARAVAPLNTLVEYLLPLIKINGRAIIYKSSKIEEELQNATKAIEILGGKVACIREFEIESLSGEVFDRKVLIVEKNKPTPQKYPRSNNKPRTSPII